MLGNTGAWTRRAANRRVQAGFVRLREDLDARVHPNRSVITRALGSDPAMYSDHFQLNIEEGDRLILCSDGLSSMISDG